MLYWAIALICCKITKKYREIRFSYKKTKKRAIQTFAIENTYHHIRGF